MNERSQTLIRFALMRPHPDTGVEEGIFGTAYALRDRVSAVGSDRQVIDKLLGWFEANLAKPERFNRSTSKGYYRRNTKGVSWLKPSATEHIAKMRELSEVLSRNGYLVSQITSDRPGYVVFEDDYQIVAEPFRGDSK